GHVGLSYLLDNGLAPYISYSESFQPVIGLNPVTNQPYIPLEGKQWELGIKYQPPGSRSLYTAAVFDLREQNRRMPDPDNPINTLQAGETRSRGLELEALASVTDNWDLIGNYTYTDTGVLEGSEAEQGHRLASVPEHMASLWSQHLFALFGIPGFTAGAGVRYVGASWDGMDELKTPSTNLFDAMIGYNRNNWGLALNATNLADERYYTTCLARGDCCLAPRRADQSRPRRAGRRVSAGLRCYRLPQRLPAAATTGPGGCRQPAVLCGLGRCRRLQLCRTPATACLGGACDAGWRVLPGRLAAHRLENAPMKLRQSMTTLHTWGGLLPSWLLFVVIFTGTLACFDKELEHWMRP